MDFLLNGAAGQPAQNKAGDLVKESSTETFVADVIEASQSVPVIVDFWAPWCGPCKQLGPALEKLVGEAKGKVRMVKINVDQNQELAGQMRIQSIPAVYAFKDGRPVDGFVGALPESQLKEFIAKLTAGMEDAPDLTEVLDEAKAFLDQGDAETALQIYQEVQHAEPDNVVAIAGMLRALIALGDTESAAQALENLPDDIAKKPEIVSVKTSLELAAQAQAMAGADAGLRKRLAENADDHQARFDLALSYFAANEREAAVEELLEIIKRDRAWNEDGARKQLIKLFEAMGPSDPLTLSARRRLSTLLFS